MLRRRVRLFFLLIVPLHLASLSYAQQPTCQVSAGTPQVLASGLNLPLLLNVDSTTVYFRDDGDGTVKSVPKCGGSITVLASALTGFTNFPGGIAAFSGIVYFVDEGGSTLGSGRLMSVSTEGGTPRVLATGVNTPTALAVDASGIYVGEEPCCSARILKFDFAGNLVSVLANDLSGVSRLAIDSVNVYFIDQAGSFSPLMSVPKSGGMAPLTLDPYGGYGSAIATDGVDIYYSSSNISNRVELRKIPVSGGTITPIAPGLGGFYANAIVVKSGFVYFAVGLGAANLYKVLINGGPATVLASEPFQIGGLATDNSSLYWTAGGFRPAGVLKKLAISASLGEQAAARARMLLESAPCPGGLLTDCNAPYFEGGGGYDFDTVTFFPDLRLNIPYLPPYPYVDIAKISTDGGYLHCDVNGCPLDFF